MFHLTCSTCAKEFPADTTAWRCQCGGLLDLTFEPGFWPDAVSDRAPDLWRYREALPVLEETAIVSFGEGYTPLLPVSFGRRSAWIKQDHLFQTGSYKDRGAALLISHARALGIKKVVEDSSGNAGCAVAAYCARAGIACDIYVPESTSPAKLEQIAAYGAGLIRIPGSREDTARAVMAAAENTFYASHTWNPFFFHGTKTWAYEVCEQLGWKAPDSVVLPAGNGTLLLGAAIGFKELTAAKIISRPPAIIAVQAEACQPLTRAFETGSQQPVKIEKRDTRAEGIAIAEPARGWQILAAVRASGGGFISVTESEIRTAQQRMASQGYFIEPTAAAVIAGLARYLSTAPDKEIVVSTFSGHGLKAAGH